MACVGGPLVNQKTLILNFVVEAPMKGLYIANRITSKLTSRLVKLEREKK